MRTALVTTTINIPHVLKLYRRYGPDVRFFVALDKKTPEEAVNFCAHDIDNTHVCYIQDQQQWSCSELIGWSCVQRRNIALLEAVRWGAGIIVTIDDDVLPLTDDYFWKFLDLFASSFCGIEVSSPSGWYDAGRLLTPVVRHRGLPLRLDPDEPVLTPVTDVDIGVAAGLWIGDADVNAVDRIAIPPAVHSATELARTGVVVAPGTRTVFNSQSTAFRRGFAPAMFMLPGVGRADDIFASLVTQRVMRESGYRVHFGQPFAACWQNRSNESLLHDLREEMLLLERVEDFETVLAHTSLHGITSVTQQVRTIYHNLANEKWMPRQAIEAGLAYCDDIEPLL